MAKESSKKIQIQKLLSQNKDIIEQLVQERTKELTGSNRQLLQKIKEQENFQQQLERLLLLDYTILEISSEFINRPADQIDSGIINALATIGQFSDIDRIALYILAKDSDTVLMTHEWRKRKTGKAEKNFHDQYFAYYIEGLRENRDIIIETSADLSDFIGNSNDSADQKKFQSFMAIPMKRQGKIYGALALYGKKAGTTRWPREMVTFVKIIGDVFVNALERKVSELAMKESEERYRDLVEKAGLAIAMDASDGSFLYFNQHFMNLFGYTDGELAKLTLADLVHPDDRNMVMTFHTNRFNNKKAPTRYEFRGIRKDGSSINVEIEVVGLFMKNQLMATRFYLWDITERKRMQEEVQKSQRLESIGLLAGGIAHDFNNLLSVILGNAQLARMMSEQGKDISKFLQNIEKGAAQAGTLTHQLLTFSKGGAPIRTVTPLGDLIKDAVQLALSGLDEHAHFEICENLYSANVDKGQIRQVIHNLILNSDQAMPSGGEIKVAARNVQSDSAKELEQLKPGPYVHVSIKDNGIGIAKDELQKIFDPYYTTKKAGSGLGLTVAYSIIKKHDGLLRLDSAVGQGTTAHMFLPAVIQEQPKELTPEPSIEPVGGRIFIMDDEELVLDVAEEMLTELGFKVQRALNGEELLSQYKKAQKARQKPDLVIMDLTIPAGMGGIEAINALRKIDPNVNAIVSSGYSNDKVMSNYQEYGFAGVVAKPFTMYELKNAIAKVRTRINRNLKATTNDTNFIQNNF